jgi:uncharacterized protein YsxB (DUF464 family)
MINITRKGNRLKIEGHAEPVLCASVSSIMYTCYNILADYDSKGVELKDSLEDGKDYDNVEMILRRNDKNTSSIWQVMCLEFEKLAEDNPQSVTYIDKNKDIN